MIMKTFTPDVVVALTDLKSQTMKATRYVLIVTLGANWSSRRSPFSCTVLIWNPGEILGPFFHQSTSAIVFKDSALTTGMLEREIYSGLLLILTEKLALKLGSSKQGNAIRALVGSKWVEARYLKIDCCRQCVLAMISTDAEKQKTYSHLVLPSLVL